MSVLRLGPCRYRPCPAHVYWCRHERTYKVAPIDPDPADDGNIRIDHENGIYFVLSGDALVEARRADEPLHLNHHATCVVWRDKWRLAQAAREAVRWSREPLSKPGDEPER